MAIGSYGTIRPSDVSPADVEIIMNYTPTRDATDSFVLTKLDAQSLLRPYFENTETGGNAGVEVIGGLYNLTLPANQFNALGIYTLYLRPAQIRTVITDCGVLSALPNVKGLVIDLANVEILGGLYNLKLPADQFNKLGIYTLYIKPAERPPAPSKPDKRPNPLKPTKPGIAPRPKALSHDVQAFLNQRKGVSEAIDTGEMPDFIDPSKRAKIENEKDYVEQILPDLGPDADRYLEIITSESYQQNIKRVAYYLGVNVNEIQSKFPNYPTMIMLAFKALTDIKKAESNLKKQLEKIAVDVVLDLEENKFIKKLVEEGDIIIDAKLGNADLTGAVTADKMDEEMDNGLTVAENLISYYEEAMEQGISLNTSGSNGRKN